MMTSRSYDIEQLLIAIHLATDVDGRRIRIPSPRASSGQIWSQDHKAYVPDGEPFIAATVTDGEVTRVIEWVDDTGGGWRIHAKGELNNGVWQATEGSRVERVLAA
jgi:hypothetical protein